MFVFCFRAAVFIFCFRVAVYFFFVFRVAVFVFCNVVLSSFSVPCCYLRFLFSMLRSSFLMNPISISVLLLFLFACLFEQKNMNS